ncbi:MULTISPECIES: hypothetical protein [Rhodococcus]|nr:MULTISPECIES: hypothetical protein [Rhodococcus]MBX4171180.1 hypothetical protein [Rhodococcus sp. DMU2021]MDJ0401472.1 hypothetical protein [Rhodococcus rhodochrous]QXF83995.1 hypothetical protein HBA53_23015 [Rhodococcus pyridinivorans]
MNVMNPGSGEPRPYPRRTDTDAPADDGGQEDLMAKAKDTVTVRLPGEHRAVSWSGGAFAGDPELVSTAQGLAAIAAQVEVAPPGGYATAGADSRQGAMVAMLGAARGRGIVVEDDPELWEGIIDPDADDGGEIIH